MASLLETAELFAKLGKKHLGVHDAACVRVRHKNARCDRCLQACAHEAITIKDNELSIDHNRCTGCGACATACPTEALYLMGQPLEKIMHIIDEAPEEGTIAFVCTQAGDPAKMPFLLELLTPDEPCALRAISVPCLAAVDESVLIHAASKGIAIRYISAVCASCPNASQELIEAITVQAVDLFNHVASHAQPSATLPLWQYLNESEERSRVDASPEMTRRGMFSELVSHTTDSLAEAAAETFSLTHSGPDAPPTLSETLMQDDGKLKVISVDRNTHILNDLYKRATPEDNTPPGELIDTRLFAEVRLDTNTCDLCGICAKFCPTKALKGTIEQAENPLTNAARPFNPFKPATLQEALFDHIDHKPRPRGALTFQANDCVGCGLCADICPQQAIRLETGIYRSDLFALEPQCLLQRS